MPLKTPVSRCVFRDVDRPGPNASNISYKFDRLTIKSPDSGFPPPKKSRIAYYLLTGASKIKLTSYPFSVGYGSSFSYNLHNSKDTQSAEERELFRLYINANYTLDLITLNTYVLVNGHKVERCITLVRGDIIVIPNSDISIKLYLEYEPAQDIRETALIKAPIYSQEPGMTLVYVFAIYGASCDSERIRQRSLTVNKMQFITPVADFTCKFGRETPHSSANSTPVCTSRAQELSSLSLPGSPAIKIHMSSSMAVRTPDKAASIDADSCEASCSSAYKTLFSSEATPSPTHLLWSTYMRERMQEQEEKVLSTSPSIVSGRSAAEYFTCLSVPKTATLGALKAEFDKQLEPMGICSRYSVHAELGKGSLDDRLENFWVFQLERLDVECEHKAPMTALKLARIQPIQHARVVYIHFY